MRFLLSCLLFTLAASTLKAQTDPVETNNIYKIRERVLQTMSSDRDNEEHEHGRSKPKDDDRAKFDRWYNFVRLRCYPSGDLPSPDVLIKAYQKDKISSRTANRTTGVHTWQPIGPMQEPLGYNGLGRVNCIVINPTDTSTIYLGSAGGGLFISHDGGHTWSAGTDDFPSLSIADIVLDPHNPDTIYAVTGDGYGYESRDAAGAFWGGLYSAGIMMSPDGGNTWQTTGLSYLQTNNDIVQKLLVHPLKTKTLLAATRHGIMRSTDAGTTWTNVAPGNHVYGMALHPLHPDTVYAVNDTDFLISYNAGQTWQIRYHGVNSNNLTNKNRATIAVSPAQPDNIWILNSDETLKFSSDMGNYFTQLSSPDNVAAFYGYYDNVLKVSPASPDNIFACGMLKAESTDGASSWQQIDNNFMAHVDNHALTFNPLDPGVIYSGNDGGIFVTRDGGDTWEDLTNGLMISQIYRMSSSRQEPDYMMFGLQDNSTFIRNSTVWTVNIGGDGQACAIDPKNDQVQVGSYQYGVFFMSYDYGFTFNPVYPNMGNQNNPGSWTSPVVFDPVNDNTMYFGLTDGVYMSIDQGGTFTNLNAAHPDMFNPSGVTSIAVAPSNPNIIYASGDSLIYASTDQGITWTNITGNLPTTQVAITHIAVDFTNPQRVFITTSGYQAGKKLFMSTSGGNTWINISSNLPNLPANCVAIDSSTKGALFVATDMGVYYRDSSMTSWANYGTGLPNVIVDDLDINYKNYKLNVATYGRGAWQVDLNRGLSVPGLSAVVPLPVQLFPNPAADKWQLMFTGSKPANYSVTVRDITGRTIATQSNKDIINAGALAKGIYMIEITAGDAHSFLKGIRQ